MKTLGKILVLILILAVSVFAIGAYSIRDFEGSTLIVVQDNVFANWDYDELVRASSEQLKSELSAGQAEQFFLNLESTLGSVKSVGPAETKSSGISVFQNNYTGRTVTLQYKALYELSPATITLVAIREGGQWKLRAFHVWWPQPDSA